MVANGAETGSDLEFAALRSLYLNLADTFARLVGNGGTYLGRNRVVLTCACYRSGNGLHKATALQPLASQRHASHSTI
jgi:hypothetical protein